MSDPRMLESLRANYDYYKDLAENRLNDIEVRISTIKKFFVEEGMLLPRDTRLLAQQAGILTEYAQAMHALEHHLTPEEDPDV